MQTRWTILATLLVGLGCSHAKPADDGKAGMADRLGQSSDRKQSETKTQPATSAEDAPSKQGANDNALYFGFDSFQLDQDAKNLLQSVAKDVKTKGHQIRVEGNCDERGTTEYNLALGDRRAKAATDYLHHLGVPASKIKSVSYGSERPKDPGHDESAWAKNRRDDVLVN